MLRIVALRIYSVFRRWLRKAIPLPVRQVFVYFFRQAARLAGVASAGDNTVSAPSYAQWIADCEVKDIQDVNLSATTFVDQPLIRVLLIYDQSNVFAIAKAVASIGLQAYPNWDLQLCGTLPLPGPIAESFEVFKSDPRIRVDNHRQPACCFQWFEEALVMAEGTFIALVGAQIELSPQALYHVARLIYSHPDADLIYGDEDKKDGDGRRLEPFFKPDWSPDLLLAIDYISGFVVVRAEILKGLIGLPVGSVSATAYDLVLRLIEKTNRIYHIPKILSHRLTSQCTSQTGSTLGLDESAKRVLQGYIQRNGLAAEVVSEATRWRIKYFIRGEPEVSVIIPTGGNVHLLAKCLQTVSQRTTYSNFEIVIVDNSRSDLVQRRLPVWTKLFRKTRYIDCRHTPFNYSLLNNQAARASLAPFLLFLNDDVEPINSDWLQAMLEHAQRAEVGAVGAKLLYPNGTLQHAGVVMGIYECTSHAFKHLPGNELELIYFDFPNVVRNCSAVTAACMLVRREVFWEVGGFDESHLPVAFQDVDLCLKMRQKGYRVIYTPYAKLYHHESQTKAEKIPNADEVRYLRRKWDQVIAHDPYYNPNLTRTREDFSAAYLD